MSGFNDRMKMGDGVQVGLACGHPHVQAGERCPKCGKELPKDTKTEATENEPTSAE